MDLTNQPTVSKDEVFTVLDELKAIGIPPTVALIRERFELAPFSLISEYIAEWSNGSALLDEDKFPPAPESISQSLSRLWAQARLLSDEETEQQRLDLAHQRKLVEKEKQEMLTEIQRLEEEQQPQIALRDRFDAERIKLELQLDLLHNDLKEARLSNVDVMLDKQRLEGDALSVVLQQGQMRIDLENKVLEVDKLTKERDDIQSKLNSLDLKQDAKLIKAEQTLSQAQNQIDELSSQLEQQKISAIDPEKVDSLENKISRLESELALSKTKLVESENNESEQRLKQESLEKKLLLEIRERNALQDSYAQVQSELSNVEEHAEQSNLKDIDKLEDQIKELTNKSIQYKNVLKDKKDRFNSMSQRYDDLKKENEALRAASESQEKISKEENITEEVVMESTDDDDLDLIDSSVPELDIPLDEDSEAKLKDGEEILELAKIFAIEDEKKAREDS